jgi:hypothetical protein
MIALVSLFSSTAHKLPNPNLYYPSLVLYTETKMYPTYSNLASYNTFFAVRCYIPLVVIDRMEQGSEKSKDLLDMPHFLHSPYSDLGDTVYSISRSPGAVKSQTVL